MARECTHEVEIAIKISFVFSYHKYALIMCFMPLHIVRSNALLSPSGLPYSVNQEQALQYPEVQKRLAQAITTLKEVTQAFCDQITSSRDLIPYAMLYMSRVMQIALQRRFPHIPEKEILKVRLVGKLWLLHGSFTLNDHVGNVYLTKISHHTSDMMAMRKLA